jgi:hypothetical protein
MSLFGGSAFVLQNTFLCPYLISFTISVSLTLSHSQKWLDQVTNLQKSKLELRPPVSTRHCFSHTAFPIDFIESAQGQDTEGTNHQSCWSICSCHLCCTLQPLVHISAISCDPPTQVESCRTGLLLSPLLEEESVEGLTQGCSGSTDPLLMTNLTCPR